MVLEQQPVDVHAVLRDALATIQGELASRQIQLEMDLASGRPIVQGDPVRLQQVFWNVLKNAVKFTPERGRISLRSSTQAGDGRTLVVRVSDTGIGIVPGELEHVFEAFSQGEHAKGVGSHRFGGLGLGLAISRKLIELHSGRIFAESEGRDRGSTFTVELPLALPIQPDLPAPGPASAAAPAEPAAAEPVGAPRAILLVEDHAPTRLALQRLLQRRRFRVLAAASVAEARAIAEKERIDLVISDIGLPDGSGYDLMAELDERFRLKGIALTGYGMESDIVRSKETGFIVHMTKPVSIQALDAAIATVSSAVLQS
jgi:CheY-like chemotaxis protein